MPEPDSAPNAESHSHPGPVLLQALPHLATASPTEALLKRVVLLMEDGDWQKADELLEQVLNNDPENAQAYFGKVLVQLKLPSAKVLISKAHTLDRTDALLEMCVGKRLTFAKLTA